MPPRRPRIVGRRQRGYLRCFPDAPARPDTCPADADSGGAAILIVLAIFGGLMLASVLAAFSHPAQGAKNVLRIEALSGPSKGRSWSPEAKSCRGPRLNSQTHRRMTVMGEYHARL